MKTINLAIGDWSRHKAKIYNTLEAENLKDMAKWIKGLPPTTVKYAMYFLRGEADYRNNDSMETIRLLIVDGDSSLTHPDRAPSPKKLHKALKDLGFNHFIYPSWSNGQKLSDGSRKRKWRLCIPCNNINTKGELRHHTALLHI